MQTMPKFLCVILIAVTILSCDTGVKKENARLKEQVRELQKMLSQLKSENEGLKDKIQKQQQLASEIGAWNGTGGKKTELFNIEKSPWSVVWTNEPAHTTSFFQIYLQRSDDEQGDLLVDTTRKASDISYLHETGSFYLSIRAAKTSWTIKVVAPK